MKKLLIISILCFCCFIQTCFAQQSKRLLVSPVNIPSVQSSYSIYPNTLDMISNDIVNYLNKNTDYMVPDLGTSKELINSYGLSKEYKDFLINYRDNRVLDYETCNHIAGSLGISKILLVSGGFDLQSLALNRTDSNKFQKLSFIAMPLYFSKIITDSAFIYHVPFIGSHVYDNLSDEDPIKPNYLLNVGLTLVDANTGLVLWEKGYRERIEASFFENPSGSFGENQLYSLKLKKLSDKISRETAYAFAQNMNTSEFTSVKSTIISDVKPKISPKNSNLTKNSKSGFNNNEQSLQNRKKESYKNWIKQQVNN